MSNNKNMETLYLKQQFGGTLSDSESASLQQWLGSDEGKHYASTADDIAKTIKEIAMVEVKPTDSTKMVVYFEDMIRNTIRKGRRTLKWALPCTAGVWLSLGLLSLFSGSSKPELAYFLIGLGLFFPIMIYAMYRDQQKLLEDPDLVSTLREREAKAKTLSVRLKGWIISAGFFFGMCWLMYQVGGNRYLMGYLILMPISTAYTLWTVKHSRKKDRDLWDWWKEDLANKTA